MKIIYPLFTSTITTGTFTSNNNVSTFFVNSTIEEDLQYSIHDVRYFARHIKVENPSGLEYLQPRNYQNGLLKRLQKNNFNIIKSTRQAGVSTMSAIYLLWYALFNPNKTIVICSDTLLFSKDILQTIYDMNLALPEHLKGKIITKQSEKLVFDNKSQIRVVSTESESFRGWVASLIFWDNCAFTKDTSAREVFKNIMPAIMSSNGKIILASSSPHTDTFTLFDEIFYDAYNGESSFKSFNIRCHQVPGRDIKWQKEKKLALGAKIFNAEYNV